jgi:uncharacterized protein (DUF2062 family)
MRRIRFIVYKWFRKVVRTRGTPHSVAAGFSIGMFVGMLPLYGFQMVVAAAVAAVARVNKIAALIPVWVTNPITIPGILYLQYLIGKLVVRGQDVKGVWPKIQRVGEAAGRLNPLELKATSRDVLLAARELSWEVLWPTIVGSLISGVLLGLASYPLALRTVLWYRRKLEERRARRRQRLAEYLAAEAGEGTEPGESAGGVPTPGP